MTGNVSIVLCTYNGARFLRQQLDSLVGQTYPVYELLVFDDRSSDDTVKILNEYATQFPFVKVNVNAQNLGYTRNFEQALHRASGDVIAISDQDDVWMLDKIEKMMKAWKPEHPLIYCNSYIFKDELPAKPKQPGYRMFKGSDARQLALVNTISGHATMCRKDFLPLVLPFSNEAMYDWWMGVVAACNGGVQHYNEVLVYHRNHESNMTVNALDHLETRERKRIEKMRLINQCRIFATAPNMPEGHKQFMLDYARIAEESLDKEIYWPLFFFMVKNRECIFHYKKKSSGLISHIKHSYRRTKNT